ncbi:putative protein phosphatase 2C 43 [Diplonema papillatum]|nr:putative protein phosphatase 2C 43 [Diplonema papillatum]
MLRRARVLLGLHAPPINWGFQVVGDLHAVSSATYQANRVNEDRSLCSDTQDGEVFLGVADGHGGCQVSNFVAHNLANHVQARLDVAKDASLRSVVRAMEEGFLALDEAYIEKVRPAFKLGFNEVRRIGACALLARLRGNSLFVANAGDCRALVANFEVKHELHDGQSVVVPPQNVVPDATFVPANWDITKDHTAMDQQVQQELLATHPNEDNVIVRKPSGACYIKGRLIPSRAIGDLDLKLMEFAGPRDSMHAPSFYSTPFTPPYISAQPDVWRYTLRAGSFCVLATDGLWDEMTSAEVYNFVVNYAGQPEYLARDLLEQAIEKVAVSCKESVEAIKLKPVGLERRTRHDDITINILMYNRNFTLPSRRLSPRSLRP